MTRWYLVADGGGVACPYRGETPGEVLELYLAEIGGVDAGTYGEIWSGDANTSDMTVSEVTEAEAKLAENDPGAWPDRPLKTHYYREG